MALIEALERLLGDAAVLTREEDLAGVIEDWRGRYRAPALCAVLPSNTEQVAAVVRLCGAHGVPVLPDLSSTTGARLGRAPEESGTWARAQRRKMRISP